MRTITTGLTGRVREKMITYTTDRRRRQFAQCFQSWWRYDRHRKDTLFIYAEDLEFIQAGSFADRFSVSLEYLDGDLFYRVDYAEWDSRRLYYTLCMLRFSLSEFVHVRHEHLIDVQDILRDSIKQTVERGDHKKGTTLAHFPFIDSYVLTMLDLYNAELLADSMLDLYDRKLDEWTTRDAKCEYAPITSGITLNSELPKVIEALKGDI